MGRLIDADDLKDSIKIKTTSDSEAYVFAEEKMNELKKWIDDVPTVEAIPKDQYAARLKLDMVAMLEELDLQIDESAAYNLEVAKVQRLIRDRIDKLKENKE